MQASAAASTGQIEQPISVDVGRRRAVRDESLVSTLAEAWVKCGNAGREGDLGKQVVGRDGRLHRVDLEQAEAPRIFAGFRDGDVGLALQPLPSAMLVTSDHEELDLRLATRLFGVVELGRDDLEPRIFDR